jgi:hypothetical protein
MSSVPRAASTVDESISFAEENESEHLVLARSELRQQKRLNEFGAVEHRQSRLSITR